MATDLERIKVLEEHVLRLGEVVEEIERRLGVGSTEPPDSATSRELAGKPVVELVDYLRATVRETTPGA